MKKVIWSTIPLILLAFVLFQPNLHAQPMAPGMMGQGWGQGYGPQQPGEGWNYCPYCGAPYRYGVGSGYGMGPGMMRRGWRMGPGMMGRGYGRGPGYGMGPGIMGPGYGYGYGPQYQQPQKPMDKEEARAMVEDYLKSTRNPNLQLGKIEDKGSGFEADIVTKDGSLVDKLAIDKTTGWMHSLY